MDIGDLLPIIFFGIALLTKFKRTANQNTEKPNHDKKTAKTIQEQVKKRTKKYDQTKPVSRRSLKEDDRLKQKPEQSIKQMGNIQAAMDHEIEDELILERYINNEREEFVKKINTPGIEAKNEVRDIIKEKEIGSVTLQFSRKKLIDAIIMSEILEKPKVLKR